MGKVFDWKRRKGNVMGSVFMFPEFGGLGLKEKVLCGMAFVAFFLFGVINGDAVYWNNSKVTAIEMVFSVLVLSAFGVRDFVRSPYVWIAVFFFIAVLGINLVGGDWGRASGMAAHFLFFAATFVLVSRIHSAALAVLLGVAAGAVWGGIRMIVAWYLMEFPSGFDWLNDPPGFANIRHFGYLLCVASVVGYWGGAKVTLSSKVLFCLVFFFSFSLMLWSGSRGAILASVSGCFFLFVIFERLRAPGVMVLYIGLLVAAMAVSAKFPVDQKGMGWVKAFDRSVQVKSLNGISTNRFAIWADSVHEIKQHPFLGNGGEAFVRAFPDGFAVQAHNGFLQVTLEWGGIFSVIFFTVVLSLFLRGVVCCRREGADSVYLYAGLSLFSTLFVLSLYDGVFYHAMPSAIFSGACAIILAEVKRLQVPLSS